MALSHSYDIVQQNGGLTAVATNDTVYGFPNQERNEAAEFLLWSKTDQAGARTFYNPDQGDVLTNLVYSLSTPIDGWYEAIKVRAQFYSAITPYVEEQSSGGEITQFASMFYYVTDGKIYKAIAPSTGQLPTDTNYFVEVPVEDLKDNLNNTNLEVYYQNFYCEYRINVCIRDKDDQSCACGNKDRDYVDGLYSLKQSADTNYANGNPEIMEKIIRQLTADCTQC